MRGPIGHADADCFYVSAERLRDAFLVGKPVGVLGNQGAAVIAKSYELKAAGVQTGEPIWDARAKCPQAVFLKRDFRWYEVVSRQVLDAIRQFSPAVEYHSIDDFFFQAVPLPGHDFEQTARALRDHTLAAVGVPLTVAIARTRVLAKLFSDTAKPFGARAVLDRDRERELLARLPVTEVSGIAGRRAARLEPVGIHTCLDLADADRLRVRRTLTRTGEALWYELNGESVLPLHTQRPAHKVLSRGGSLGGATAEADRLYAWLARNLERLIEELEFHGVRAGTLTVYVQGKEGGGGSHTARLVSPTDRFDLLLEAGGECLAHSWDGSSPIGRMHVFAGQLRRPGEVQRGLFEPPAEQARAVADLKREVNAAVGRFTLRSGATLPLADVYRDQAQGYDICDIRGKMCF